MEKKILLAVDGSEKSLAAVSILGEFLKDHSEFGIHLFHSVQQLASLYPGEIAELDATRKLPADVWTKVGNMVLRSCEKVLLECGFPAERITMDLVADGRDPAQDILGKAESAKVRTIALGRKGRSQVEKLLLGSVSSKVAQYALHRTVWIVDPPVNDSRKVLIALEGVPDSRALTYYASEFLAPIPDLRYTLLHIMPPIPPAFWDDGHILGAEEQKERQSGIEKWRNDWMQRINKFMDEARYALQSRGVPAEKVEARVLRTKEGIARDLLNEIARGAYQMVVIGKRSFVEKKPFLLGSHANKILQAAKNTILCLVDAT